MQINIRPFSGQYADYEALALVHSAAFPDYQTTPDEWQRQDQKRDPKCPISRFAAEIDGQVVATSSFANIPWYYHPQQFEIGVIVHPEYRRRGIGARVYLGLVAELGPYNPLKLRGYIREDHIKSMRFARQRGFVEEVRAWESRLDVVGFDPTRFAGAAERVAAQGIRITTARELSAGDPEFWTKLYEMDIAATYDVPMPEPYTPASFEQWMQWFNNAPNYLPDAYFVAVDGDRLVGVSSLWSREAGDYLDTGFTAVSREYRGRGIALALKLCAIDYARRVGAPEIRTDNASTNRPMLRINEALGFVKQPAWITMVKA